MRIKLWLRPEQYPAWLPLNNHPLAAIIYQAISQGSKKYGTFLHDQGYRKNNDYISENKRFKFFVFSRPNVEHPRLKDGCLWFEQGMVKWQISSPVEEFMEWLIAGLLKEPRLYVTHREHKMFFTVEKVEPVKTPSFSATTRFVALSPLMVSITDPQSLQKHYVRADDPLFAQCVANNLLTKYETLTGQAPSDTNVHFQFDWDYIAQRSPTRQSSANSTAQISKLVQYKDINVKAYLAPFIVTAAPELLHLGWECGFGNANSQGFGMAAIG
jgi:CRISPR-associated endoribonuclease Cas6